MSDDAKPSVTEIFAGKPREYVERNALSRHFEQHASNLVQRFADDMAGYVIVGVAKNGDWSVDWCVDPASPMGDRMLAGIAIAGINNDMICETAIKEALQRNGFIAPDKDGEATIPYLSAR